MIYQHKINWTNVIQPLILNFLKFVFNFNFIFLCYNNRKAETGWHMKPIQPPVLFFRHRHSIHA